MQRFRSVLFTPAHRPDLIQKALASGADQLVFDLEDSVPEMYRRTAAIELTLRVPLAIQETAWVRLPSAALLPRNWQGTHFVLAKSLSFQDVYDTIAAVRIRRDAWCQFLVPVEHPRLLSDLDAVVRLPTVRGLVFGPHDYRAVMRRRNCPLAGVRERIVSAARAYGKIAVDLPAYEEAEFFRASYEVGFDGAALLSPQYIPLAHNFYRVTESDRQWADQILKDAEGLGAVARLPDGTLIAPPVLALARAIQEDA